MRQSVDYSGRNEALMSPQYWSNLQYSPKTTPTISKWQLQALCESLSETQAEKFDPASDGEHRTSNNETLSCSTRFLLFTAPVIHICSRNCLRRPKTSPCKTHNRCRISENLLIPASSVKRQTHAPLWLIHAVCQPPILWERWSSYPLFNPGRLAFPNPRPKRNFLAETDRHHSTFCLPRQVTPTNNSEAVVDSWIGRGFVKRR